LIDFLSFRKPVAPAEADPEVDSNLLRSVYLLGLIPKDSQTIGLSELLRLLEQEDRDLTSETLITGLLFFVVEPFEGLISVGMSSPLTPTYVTPKQSVALPPAFLPAAEVSGLPRSLHHRRRARPSPLGIKSSVHRTGSQIADGSQVVRPLTQHPLHQTPHDLDGLVVDFKDGDLPEAATDDDGLLTGQAAHRHRKLTVREIGSNPDGLPDPGPPSRELVAEINPATGVEDPGDRAVAEDALAVADHLMGVDGADDVTRTAVQSCSRSLVGRNELLPACGVVEAQHGGGEQVDVSLDTEAEALIVGHESSFSPSSQRYSSHVDSTSSRL
jgi:hypothetical protein